MFSDQGRFWLSALSQQALEGISASIPAGTSRAP
jgi:hypothetical protein